MRKEKIKKIVRDNYARIARQEGSCCKTNSCCGGGNIASYISKKIGYTEKEISSVPEGANLGLGCGGPVALASLKKGEFVLDLGSGAGFDCFLASRKVGKKGKVIGVDMTPEMTEKARRNSKRGNYKNVEFRLGELENLPVADGSVDVVISNCVINLVPDKKTVFREIFRVLKPGGRMMVSDIVLLKKLPEPVRNSANAYAGCISGAVLKDRYIDMIKIAGFKYVKIIEERKFPVDLTANDYMANCCGAGMTQAEITDTVLSIVSISIHAGKPVR